jgi:hypothetical protein
MLPFAALLLLPSVLPVEPDLSGTWHVDAI